MNKGVLGNLCDGDGYLPLAQEIPAEETQQAIPKTPIVVYFSRAS